MEEVGASQCEYDYTEVVACNNMYPYAMKLEVQLNVLFTRCRVNK